MVVRKRKKKIKQLGSRTKHGNTKNARGSGTRGGKGMAGGHKHRFSLCYKNFGIKIRMKTKKNHLATMKLSELAKEIPRLLEKKLAEKKENEIIVYGERARIEKVFGKCELKEALVLKNIKASASAKQSIENAKGRVELEAFKERQKAIMQEQKEKVTQ